MDTDKVRSFFNKRAAFWDEQIERDESVISFILEKGGVSEGKKVLDVATGTGVLIGDYLERGAVATGIDISDEMIKSAKRKFPQVSFICGDAQSYSFDEVYDVIMIYNAFPHFTDPEELFSNLSRALKKGGRLTVAHGMSEEALRKHHSGEAREISRELPDNEELAKLMSPYLKTDIMISDERMYMVSGEKL